MGLRRTNTFEHSGLCKYVLKRTTLSSLGEKGPPNHNLELHKRGLGRRTSNECRLITSLKNKNRGGLKGVSRKKAPGVSGLKVMGPCVILESLGRVRRLFKTGTFSRTVFFQRRDFRDTHDDISAKNVVPREISFGPLWFDSWSRSRGRRRTGGRRLRTSSRRCRGCKESLPPVCVWSEGPLHTRPPFSRGSLQDCRTTSEPGGFG